MDNDLMDFINKIQLHLRILTLSKKYSLSRITGLNLIADTCRRKIRESFMGMATYKGNTRYMKKTEGYCGHNTISVPSKVSTV